MAYTQEQQARIDAANAKVKSAEDAYNTVSNQLAGQYSVMQDTFTRFQNANCNYDWAPGGLDGQIYNFGSMNPESCHSGIRCSRATCRNWVAQFNTNYNDWHATFLRHKQAKTNLETARAELQKLLNTINQEVQSDPDFIQQQQQTAIEGDIAKQRNRYIIIGVIVVVVIIVLGFIYVRFIK